MLDYRHPGPPGPPVLNLGVPPATRGSLATTCPFGPRETLVCNVIMRGLLHTTAVSASGTVWMDPCYHALLPLPTHHSLPLSN